MYCNRTYHVLSLFCLFLVMCPEISMLLLHVAISRWSSFSNVYMFVLYSSCVVITVLHTIFLWSTLTLTILFDLNWYFLTEQNFAWGLHVLLRVKMMNMIQTFLKILMLWKNESSLFPTEGNLLNVNILVEGNQSKTFSS